MPSHWSTGPVVWPKTAPSAVVTVRLCDCTAGSPGADALPQAATAVIVVTETTAASAAAVRPAPCTRRRPTPIAEPPRRPPVRGPETADTAHPAAALKAREPQARRLYQ